MNRKNIVGISKYVVVAVVVSLTAIVISGCATPSLPGGQIANSITVTGFGEASGDPDVAYIEMGFSARERDISTGLAAANDSLNSIKEALMQAGIDEKDIQTSGFGVYPEDVYDPDSGRPTGERFYNIQNNIRVTVRDVDGAGEIIEAGLEAGANQVYNLSFGVENTSALEQEARNLAVEDAQARAEALAEKLGVEVGDVITITDGSGYVNPYPGYGFGGGGAAEAASVSPGQFSYQGTVNVTYAIVR